MGNTGDSIYQKFTDFQHFVSEGHSGFASPSRLFLRSPGVASLQRLGAPLRSRRKTFASQKTEPFRFPGVAVKHKKQALGIMFV